MAELSDHELLTEFARTGAEHAFATLVTRHVNLVHSTARRFTSDDSLAEEITQAVFIILARKAGGISARVVLTGWLYQTARLTAANALKENIRRQRREQEAYMESTLTTAETDDAWKQIAPVLDDAMGGLREADRNAVLLRYFENQPLAEVGAALGVSEDAARVRVNRALEKLRATLTKSGVTLGVTLIAGAVGTNSVQAAPVGMAVKLSVVAAKGVVTTTASTLALVKGTMNLMAWAKVKFTMMVSAILLFFAAGTTTVIVSQAAHKEPAYISQLRTEGGMVVFGVLYPTQGRHKSQLNLWFATEASFKTLTNAQDVDDLEIVGTDLRTPAFNLISNLTNLKSLSTVNCKIMPAQLAAIQHMTNLENLKLELIPALLDESSETRAKLLGELSPDETQTASMLKREGISKRHGLSDNLLQATLLTDRAMPYLSKLTKLKTLNLARAYISPDGLKQLIPLTNLEEVNIGLMGLSRETAKPLQAMTRLRSLEYFNVDDGVVDTLSKITSLEHLNIWSGDVTDAGALSLTTLINLNHLEIRGNKMTDEGFLLLSQLTKLKYLDIQFAKKITTNAIAQFQKLRSDVEIKH